MSDWHVAVVGRVVHVRARPGGGWRLRLADTGGALATAEIRPSNLLPPPIAGTRVVLCGRAQYRIEHGWYSVDPVIAWIEARTLTPAFAWADSPAPARGQPSGLGALS